MPVEWSLTAVLASVLDGLWTAALSIDTPTFIISAIILPVIGFVVVQALAGVIGFHAQRMWVKLFRDREQELLAANEMLRVQMARVLAVNSTLAAESQRLQSENERVLARALKAELRLSEQDVSSLEAWSPAI